MMYLFIVYIVPIYQWVEMVFFCLLIAFLFSTASSAEVLKIVVNDAIHPITDEYIGRAIVEVLSL